MDDSQKKSIMMAILAFNLTFILFMVLFNFNVEEFSYTKVLLGLLIASGAAAGGFFGAKMMG